MIFEGIYRRFAALKGGRGNIDARFTHIESLAIDQVAPSGLEMSRAGRRFYIAYNGTAPTGIAPVQALPTTAAQWAIWNADPARALVLKSLGVMVASGTPGVGGQLLAALFTAPVQSGAQATGIAVASASNGGLTSKAVVKSAVTISAPAAGLWIPIAENPSANVGAFPGSGVIINRQLDGRIVIPPGMGLGLVTLALAGTTPLFVPIAEWVEVETDLE